MCGAHMMGGASNAISRGEIAIVAAIVPVPLVLAGGADAQVVVMEWRTDSGGETVEVASASARVTPHLRARARRIHMQAPAAAHHQSPSMSLASDLLYGGGVGGVSRIPPPPPRSGGSRATFATGTIQETDGASNGFTPYHTHPASLDNALQLAAACATAASDRRLLVPAAFTAFAAPRANSGGARLRASADVCMGEAAQSQSSNHALLGSSGVLLARVKGLDARAMRLGAVPAGEPAATPRESDVPGRRAIMYRLESLAAGPYTPTPSQINPTFLKVHRSVYPNTLAASIQTDSFLKGIPVYP